MNIIGLNPGNVRVIVEREEDGKQWIRDAASVRKAVGSMHVPLGWGGHGRSERQLDELAEGRTIHSPLGTYRIVIATRGEKGANA